MATKMRLTCANGIRVWQAARILGANSSWVMGVMQENDIAYPLTPSSKITLGQFFRLSNLMHQMIREARTR